MFLFCFCVLCLFIGREEMKDKIRILCGIVAAIFFFDIGLVILYGNEYIYNAKTKNKIIAFAFLIAMNTLLSFTHEVGHVLFAEKAQIKIIRIKLDVSRIVPLWKTQFEVEKKTKGINKALFFMGGSIADAFLGGVAGILFLLLKNTYIWYVMCLEILRIVINCIPVDNSDGRKILCLMYEKK